jgi:hypothetical protein
MTDYATATTAELVRNWCGRVGWTALGPLEAWKLAGIVLDEMTRRGWNYTVSRYSTQPNADILLSRILADHSGTILGAGEDPAIERAALIAALRALDDEGESNDN